MRIPENQLISEDFLWTDGNHGTKKEERERERERAYVEI